VTPALGAVTTFTMYQDHQVRIYPEPTFTNESVDPALGNNTLTRKVRYNYEHFNATELPLTYGSTAEPVWGTDYIGDLSWEHTLLRLTPGGYPSNQIRADRYIPEGFEFTNFTWQVVFYGETIYIDLLEHSPYRHILSVGVGNGWGSLSVLSGSGWAPLYFTKIPDRPLRVTISSDGVSGETYLHVNNTIQEYIATISGVPWTVDPRLRKRVTYYSNAGPLTLCGENSNIFTVRYFNDTIYQALNTSLVDTYPAHDERFDVYDIDTRYRVNKGGSGYGDFWSLQETNLVPSMESVWKRNGSHYQLPYTEWARRYPATGTGTGLVYLRNVPDGNWMMEGWTPPYHDEQNFGFTIDFTLGPGMKLYYAVAANCSVVVQRTDQNWWQFSVGGSAVNIWHNHGEASMAFFTSYAYPGEIVCVLRLGGITYGKSFATTPYSYITLQFQDHLVWGTGGTEYLEITGWSYIPFGSPWLGFEDWMEDLVERSIAAPFTYYNASNHYDDYLSGYDKRRNIEYYESLVVPAPPFEHPLGRVTYATVQQIDTSIVLYTGNSTLTDMQRPDWTGYTSIAEPPSQEDSFYAWLYYGSNSTVLTNGTVHGLVFEGTNFVGGNLELTARVSGNITTPAKYDCILRGYIRLRVWYRTLVESDASGDLMTRAMNILAPFLMLFIFPIAFREATGKNTFALIGLLFGVFVLGLTGALTTVESVVMGILAIAIVSVYLKSRGSKEGIT